VIANLEVLNKSSSAVGEEYRYGAVGSQMIRPCALSLRLAGSGFYVFP